MGATPSPRRSEELLADGLDQNECDNLALQDYSRHLSKVFNDGTCSLPCHPAGPWGWAMMTVTSLPFRVNLTQPGPS